MTLLLPTRILWHRFGIRGATVFPTAVLSTSTLPSSFVVDVQHRFFGAAIHSECALYNNPVGDPSQSANDRFMKHCNRSKSGYHWKQQRRFFAHQTDSMTYMTLELASLQSKLFREASYLTRTLYRKCLQSTMILAKGNERDEDDFATREDEERNQFSDGVDLERISMAPPVNRQNELSSRANYYKTFTREHFDGHWSLLGAHGFHIGNEGNMSHGLGGGGLTHQDNGGGQQWNQYQGGHHHLGGQMSAQYQGGGENSALRRDDAESNTEHVMWREDKVEQFVYLIKSGEEKRQWVLNDYEFEDSCHDGWPKELEDRLKNFEALTGSLIKEVYRRKGWIHSSDYNNHEDKDDCFSDSDSDDDL